MMRSLVLMLLIGSLALGGCGRISGWFGLSRSAPTAASGEVNPLIPRRGLAARAEEVYAGTPVADVTAMNVERIPGGAIIRATGVMAQQGGYDAQLVLREDQEDASPSELTYDFMVVQPATGRVGSTASREVVVATALTDQDLEGVRVIRVVGARTTRSSRR